MKRSLFILFVAAILTALGAKAQLTADWKTYMPFDSWPVQVVETPGRVYVLNRTFEDAKGLPERAVPSHSLFYYDKDGEEMVSVNARANSNGNAVACIGYNASKKYLLVVYTDCNIDFLYDDGRVYNLAALKMTSIPGKKEVNSITFDNSASRAYLATTFGYVALNDERHEVAESRTYGENVQSVARCGSDIVMCIDGKVYHAPASGQRFGMEDYAVLEGAPAINSLVPLDSDGFIGYTSAQNSYIEMFTKNGDTYDWSLLFEDPRFFGIQQIEGGAAYRLTGNVRLFYIGKNGAVVPFNRPQDEYARPAASYDGSRLWALTERKGLRGYRKNGEAWDLTNDYIRPNAPAAYIASSFAYSPDYGMLCGSNGADLAYSELSQQTPSNISALKGGFWKEYGPVYHNSPFQNVVNYGGLSIDPSNKNHVYRTSTVGGMMRVDLSNPDNVMIFANPSNRYASNNGFVKVADDLAVWNILCRFTPPQFTADGTLWTLYGNLDEDRGELWCWPAADRLATTSASTYRPMKKIKMPADFVAGNSDCMIALNVNKNIVVIGGSESGGAVLVYDHNGTPENTSDDRYVYMHTPYDQDGGGVSFLAVNNLYEDPSTGLVWILSQRGLFTFNPATIFNEPNRVNRIKVARNDGTNLADYLLNEINVNHLAADGEGRKWFATSNGLVCTTVDGRNILAEFTSENSYLPGDNIYAVGYNEENNSMLVATDGGLVEMFPSGSGGATASGDSDMRVYPNPVEPDYYGWVRIDNIADGSLVKITDSRGGLVRELGPAQSGSVEWDVSGLDNTRVSTGVYYIMVSPGSGGDGQTKISKILVLN